MPHDLPSGTVTFLFTDIEGSTRLLHELGPEAYAEALAEHRRALREAFARHHGLEMGTEGDAFFVVFAAADDAVQAAAEGTDSLRTGGIRVRMRLHTGTPLVTEEGYVGAAVHLAARVAAAGHGGQILLSKDTRDLIQADVTDLGEHRLKDFAEPVPIFQLGGGRFPPLKTISNTNLPRPASSFVGREKEVHDVTTLLRDGTRFVTLTGPGGSGKTRLAIEAAAEVVPEFVAGVFWVELAPLRDAALVVDSISGTLGAKDALADHIGDRHILLVLDNLEQVIDIAPELASLVESCPNLALLLTSRETLRVRAEVEYPVPPLAEPDAVELFCARSRLEPDETIAELCRRLDNLPLAVELAAARTTVLPPAQILDRLAGRLDLLKGGRDAEARQQTLRLTIEWSYDLLTDAEKRLFARLAVFAGGCTLDAAEAVADAALDPLQSLVDKSLVRHTDDRFWMLETIRAYAIERLDGSGEAEDLHRRHAGYFRALADEAEPHVLATSKECLDRLEREHDNLRAALDSLEASGDTQSVLRMSAALSEFWDERGHQMEGRRRLERALRMDERPTEARADALTGAAAVALSGGDAASARLWAEEALELHRAIGDAHGMARAELQLGAAAGNEGDFDTARDLLGESVELFRRGGDEHLMLVAKRYLAWAYRGLGDADRERSLLEEVLLAARRLGDDRMEASAVGALAMIAADDGRVDDALSMLERSHRLHVAHGDLVQVGLNLCRFASVLAGAGRARIAAMILGLSQGMREEIGAHVPWVESMNDETMASIRSDLDQAAFEAAWNEGQGLALDDAIASAMESRI
ncbi:MAG: adenylate/guanylate cyclase domain-containing protein [Actinomycetota bacterium]